MPAPYARESHPQDCSCARVASAILFVRRSAVNPPAREHAPASFVHPINIFGRLIRATKALTLPAFTFFRSCIYGEEAES